MATAGRPKSRRQDRRLSLDVRDTGFPPSFMETTPHQGHELASDSGDSTAEQLQRDIQKLQDEIKILSASRAQERRKSIRQALESDDYSLENFRDNFGLGAKRAAPHKPPRTSAQREGEGENGEFSNSPPSVSTTEQSRNVKAKLSARKSANSSKCRPRPQRLSRTARLGIGFSETLKRSQTCSRSGRGLPRRPRGALMRAEMMTEPFLRKL